MRNALTDPRLGRFLINGLVATSVHYVVLTLLIELAQFRSAGLANGCAAFVGIATSYLGARMFVFESRSPVFDTLPRFLLISAIVSALHSIVLAVWSDWWRLPYPAGFIIATAGSTAINYLAAKFFIFRHQAVNN